MRDKSVGLPALRQAQGPEEAAQKSDGTARGSDGTAQRQRLTRPDGEPVEPSALRQAQRPKETAQYSQEATQKPKRTVPKPEEATYTGSLHPELVQALIDWRRERYTKDNVPAYVILHQKTLLAIADLAPTTKEELLTIKGLGKSKCDKYGDEILEIIRASKSQGSNE